MSQLTIHAGTRDLVREGGTFTRVQGIPEVRQHVQIRLGLFLGECVLAATRGMRYIGLIFEKGTPAQLVENEVAETILGTPGMVALTSIDVDGPDALRLATCAWAGLASLDDYNRRVPIHDTTALAPGRSTTT